MPYYAEENWMTIDRFGTNLSTSEMGKNQTLYSMIYISPVANLTNSQSRSMFASIFRLV